MLMWITLLLNCCNNLSGESSVVGCGVCCVSYKVHHFNVLRCHCGFAMSDKGTIMLTNILNLSTKMMSHGPVALASSKLAN